MVLFVFVRKKHGTHHALTIHKPSFSQMMVWIEEFTFPSRMKPVLQFIQCIAYIFNQLFNKCNVLICDCFIRVATRSTSYTSFRPFSNVIHHLVTIWRLQQHTPHTMHNSIGISVTVLFFAVRKHITECNSHLDALSKGKIHGKTLSHAHFIPNFISFYGKLFRYAIRLRNKCFI